MMSTFQSFPTISLKKLSDSDTISIFKEKIQYNFDQLYLNYVNRIAIGNKGERGYSGLSIKGIKGDQGETGTRIFFATVADGDAVTNPAHRLGDMVITPSGQYFEVDSVSGYLAYSLQYYPSAPSIFSVEHDFTLLGSISTHQRFGTTDYNSVILAEKSLDVALYKHLVLGSNAYQSSTIDTLTVVNLLDADAYEDSTPSKQISLRFRDSQTNNASLTSFDFIYEVLLGTEYKSIGGQNSSFSIISDVLTGISTAVINAEALFFSGGLSNYKDASPSNSICLEKYSAGTWKLKYPMSDQFLIGDSEQVVLYDGKVGIRKSPTVDFDALGDFSFYTEDSYNVGEDRGYLKSTPTGLELGYKTDFFTLEAGSIYGEFNTSFWGIRDEDIFWLRGDSAFGITNLSATLCASADRYLTLTDFGASLKWADAFVLLSNDSVGIAKSLTKYLTITDTLIQLLHDTVSVTIDTNGITTETANFERVIGKTGNVEFIPKTASHAVILRENVSMVNPVVDAITNGIGGVSISVPSGVRYVGTTTTSSSPIYHDAEIFDRYISVMTINGVNSARLACYVELGDTGTYNPQEVRTVDEISVCSFLVPAGCRFHVSYIYTASNYTATCYIQSRKFGV